jgi:hypothetical protein
MRLLAIALLAVVSTNAFAVGWGQQTQIRGYYIWDEGVAYIRTDNNQNPDGCTSAQYLSIASTSSNFKYIWSQIVAAHTADQTVSLFYDGCIGPYPKVRAIAIPNVW